MDNLYFFYDWLKENNGFNGFVCVLIGCLIGFWIIYHLPFFVMNILTFFIVLFGFKNDIWRDKYLWHDLQTYIIRKLDNLYDENGFCVKSLFYKYKVRNFLKRNGK